MRKLPKPLPTPPVKWSRNGQVFWFSSGRVSPLTAAFPIRAPAPEKPHHRVTALPVIKLFQLFQGVSALFQKCFIAVSSSVPRVSTVSRFFAFQPVGKLSTLNFYHVPR